MKVLTMNGKSNNVEINNYYATDPIAIDDLLKKETFKQKILELCVGGGHLAKRLEQHNYDVKGLDIIDRGYTNTQIQNCLDLKHNSRDIITNPPYKNAQEIIEHLIKISDNGVKIAVVLKLTFLESVKRYDFFQKYPPKKIYVYSRRLQCGKNGVFEGSSAVAYGWYIWEVGNYNETKLGWIK